MRKTMLGCSIAVLSSLLAMTARASDVEGRVVCAGTETGVPNVGATLSLGSDVASGSTDANGVFNLHVANVGPSVSYDLVLDLAPAGGTGTIDAGSFPITVLASNPNPIQLGTFEVNVPACSPPPPACQAPAGLADGYLCADRPLGNPRAECGAFDLAALDKNDNVSGPSTTAEYSAALVIVKAGSCTTASGGTGAAYNYYVNVTAGDQLDSPTSGSISHVTYCTCR